MKFTRIDLFYRLYKRGLVCCFKKRAACDKDVCACRRADLCSLRVDAAVDLQLAAGIFLIDIRADGPHLGHHVGHETLSAEARLDRHDQNQIDKADERQNSFCRRFGFDADRGPFAAGADDAERLKRVFLCVGLDMDGHDVRASLTKALGIAHGAVDHQMHVERQIRHLADAGQNGQSD